MLNKRFEEVIEMAVGKEKFLSLQTTEGFRYAMRQFDESIKPTFNPFDDPDGSKVHYISFPKSDLKDDPVNFIEANCYTLTQ
jgi:hypothetical protein